jgi:hypothetical protein
VQDAAALLQYHRDFSLPLPQVTDAELHEISKYSRQAQKNGLAMNDNESVNDLGATDYLLGTY